MKKINISALTFTSILLSLVLFAISGYAQDSTKFRDLAEIKINKHPLLKVLEVHDSGLKQIEREAEDVLDHEIIKKKLSKFLGKYDLDLDYLKESDLSNLKLINSDLRYFNLKEADMHGSSLQNANLRYVNFKEANLINTNFSNANLENANLKEAKVENAIFKNADLQGVDIHEATGLTIDQLVSSKSLYKTDLPEELELKVNKIRPDLFKKP